VTTTGPARSRSTILVALAALALIGAGGCAGTPAASADSSTPAAAAGSTPSTGNEQGVKFAECVRGHGVADFPDPDASGDFDYGVSVSPDVWTKAVDACKDLQPPGTLSSNRTPEEQDQGLEFARCVRENGVADFPDPVDGEPLINTYKIPSSDRPGGMSILNAAIAKCRDQLAGAIAGH
jgi:hypothetical protein